MCPAHPCGHAGFSIGREAGRAHQLQGSLAHKKPLTPLEPPKGPRHSPTSGSWVQVYVQVHVHVYVQVQVQVYFHVYVYVYVYVYV